MPSVTIPSTSPGDGDIAADPRFGDGYDGRRIGDLVLRLDGGIKQTFRRWGTGANDWHLVGPPSIFQAQSADDVQDICREAILLAPYFTGDADITDEDKAEAVAAMAILPSNFRPVRPTATNSVADIDTAIVDLIGNVDLTPINGLSRYVHVDPARHAVAARTLQGTAGWSAASGGLEPIGMESFARIHVLRLLEIPVDGSQRVFSSGDGGAGVGTHALGFNTAVGGGLPFPLIGTGPEGEMVSGDYDGMHGIPAGTPFVYFKDVDGNVITFANRDAGSWLDGGIHIVNWGIFRGDFIDDDAYATMITDTNGWLNGYQDTPALGSFGSMANAGAVVGYRDGRYGTVCGASIHAFLDLLFMGESAENALYHGTALCDSRSGLLAI